jgi:hypothetical protein
MENHLGHFKKSLLLMEVIGLPELLKPGMPWKLSMVFWVIIYIKPSEVC